MTNAKNSFRYKLSRNVILIEAKLQRSPESFRGEPGFQSLINLGPIRKPK
jgi:hypothetical protein